MKNPFEKYIPCNRLRRPTPINRLPPVEKMDKKHLEEVLQIINSLPYGGVAETALVATKLHMFNFVRAHPEMNIDEITGELSRMERISAIETKASDPHDPRPTIGIEIETLHKSSVLEDEKELLDSLNVPCFTRGLDEPGYESNPYLEVRPSFSYHALVQARILQELATMGIIRTKRQWVVGPRRVSKSDSLSLHINIGVPDSLQLSISESESENHLHLIKNLITAAFTSEDRIKTKKQQKQVHIETDAAASEKNTPPDGEPAPFDQYKRIEFSTVEFRDYPTFRLLVEIQNLMAMTFAYIKKSRGVGAMSEQGLALENLYKEFLRDAQECLIRNGITQPMGLYDKEEMCTAMGTTSLRAEARQLVTRYSKKVAAIIGDEKRLSGPAQ